MSLCDSHSFFACVSPSVSLSPCVCFCLTVCLPQCCVSLFSVCESLSVFVSLSQCVLLSQFCVLLSECVCLCGSLCVYLSLSVCVCLFFSVYLCLCVCAEGDFTAAELRELLRRMMKACGKPAVTGFPFGHKLPFRALDFTATVTVRDGKIAQLFE